MLEAKVKMRDFVDEFKLALISHDPAAWIPSMFPEWKAIQGQAVPALPSGTQTSGAEEVVTEVDDVELDNSEGAWKFTEKITPEEADRILAEMTRSPGGEITMDDLEEWQ